MTIIVRSSLCSASPTNDPTASSTFEIISLGAASFPNPIDGPIEVCAVDADKIGFPLICRTMQEGDRFSPYGLKGSKSVADFLNSRKVDLLFKSILPVLTKKDGSIVCLPSLEIDDRYKVTSESKKVLTVSAQVC